MKLKLCFRLIGGCGLLSALPMSAFAENEVLKDWAATKTSDGTTFAHKSNRAAIFMQVIQRSGDEAPETLLQNFSTKTAETCPGINTQPIVQVVQIGGHERSIRNTKLNCSFIIVPDKTESLLVVAIDEPSSGIDSRKTAYSFIDIVAPKKSASASPVATPATTPTPSNAAIQAQLKAALASVPAAHRPIGTMMRSGTEFTGSEMNFVSKPWILFANGFATDCFDWDPRTTAPNPQSVNTKDCNFLRWRKTGTEYQIQDSDGEWDESKDISEFSQVKDGTTYDVTLKATSRFSTLAVWGAPGILNLSFNFITLRKDGVLELNNKRSYRQNADQTNYASQSSAHYHLGGQLIAIADEQGRIKVRFFSILLENGKPNFAFLDGVQYSPPD